MINFVERRFLYLSVSLVAVIAAIVVLVVSGIKPGIEFSSGSTMTLVFARDVTQEELRSAFAEAGFEQATIQQTGREKTVITSPELNAATVEALAGVLKEKFGSSALFVDEFDQTTGSVNVFFSRIVDKADMDAALASAGLAGAEVSAVSTSGLLVRTSTVGQEPGTDAAGNPASSDMDRLRSVLSQEFGVFGMFDFYSVSPTVATDVVRNAVIAVLAASVAILFYITYAFRRMPKPIRWGTCAIVAMVHNIILVLGVFAVLGLVLGVEVDAMFITGVLTIVGYSVHDTIVVFDRIRENITKGVSRDMAVTINCSLMETVGRSLNTSATTVFVLLALLLMGGVTIRYFVLVMLIGIAVGTYSSIFVASQLLVVWEKKEWRRFVPFLRPA